MQVGVDWHAEHRQTGAEQRAFGAVERTHKLKKADEINQQQPGQVRILAEDGDRRAPLRKEAL